MKTISNPREMMCGAYILEMANPGEASRIISKFSGCPNWPVITKGPKENEVFILAIELKRQCHGDFSEDNNSLVEIPELIGAKRTRFIRIQNWGEFAGRPPFQNWLLPWRAMRQRLREMPSIPISLPGLSRRVRNIGGICEQDSDCLSHAPADRYIGSQQPDPRRLSAAL